MSGMKGSTIHEEGKAHPIKKDICPVVSSKECSHPVRPEEIPQSNILGKIDILNQWQKTYGNATVNRMVAKPQGLDLLHPGIIQRRNRRNQSPTAHVGGAGTYTYLEGDRPNQIVSPGDVGYARQMLTQTGAAAAALRGNYTYAELTPVEPNFTGLDRQIRQRAAEVDYFERKGHGTWESFGSNPSTVAQYDAARDWCRMNMQALETNRSEEEEKITYFNNWVPRANSFLVSLTRLEAMQNMLGADNPATMASALITGLQDAQAVASRVLAAFEARNQAQALDIPPMDNTVIALQEDLTLKQNQLNTAWLGFQRDVLLERASAAYQEGAADRARLEKINQVKQFVRNVGTTIDLSMSVMRQAPKAIDRATATVQRTEARINAWRNRRAVMAGGDATHPEPIPAGEEGSNITMAHEEGIDLSSLSVSGVLGTIADFAYDAEVREINSRLNQITERCNAISGTQEGLLIRQRVQAFQDSLNSYANTLRNLTLRMAERRDQYLRFGTMLDNFAWQDAESRRAGQGVGRNEERYATIFVVVSQIREILSIGSNARSGFNSPQQIQSWALGLQNIRTERGPRTDITSHRIPDEEWSVLDNIYRQTSRFKSNSELLDSAFGGVERQASSLMAGLHPGAGGRTSEGGPNPAGNY
jgi:hypothetical protein